MSNHFLVRFQRTFLRFGRDFGPLAGLIVICLVMWAATPNFLTPANLTNVLLQSTINATLAIGMTYVIITAGIDLSVGSLLALVGVVMAAMLKAEWPLSITIIVTLAFGTLCGFMNGAFVSWGKLPPFIVTLGMMSAARGGALLASSGRPISGFDESFRWIATGSIAWVPVPIIILAALCVSSHIVLRRTSFGRKTIAIGSNEEAAVLSGVNVSRHKFFIYGFSGFCCAAAAILLTARLNSAAPTAGINYELDAIAASVIGGTSLMGGEGGIPGAIIGALIIGVLRNGLNLLNVSSYLQSIVIGGVIVVAALLDRFIKSQHEH